MHPNHNSLKLLHPKHVTEGTGYAAKARKSRLMLGYNWPFLEDKLNDEYKSQNGDKSKNKTSNGRLHKVCSKQEFEKKLDAIVRAKNTQKRSQSSNDYQKFIQKLNKKYTKKSASTNRLLQNTPFSNMGSISLKNFKNKNYEVFKSLFKDLSVRT